VLGPDLMDPRKYKLIYKETHKPDDFETPAAPEQSEQKEG